MPASKSAFDHVLDETVGQGRYQYISYFFIGLVAMADEAEMMTMSVTLSTLSKQFNLDDD